MYTVEVNIDGKWYDLTDFDDYEELEAVGEVQETCGLPDGLDLESNFDALQEWLSLSDDDQDVMLAYYEGASVFDWSEASDAYAGEYLNGAEFAEEFCEEAEADTLGDLPDYLKHHIDWQAVWDYELRHDYFEQDGHYFRNL